MTARGRLQPPTTRWTRATFDIEFMHLAYVENVLPSHGCHKYSYDTTCHGSTRTKHANQPAVESVTHFAAHSWNNCC